ncbi:glycosyltransferase family 2 protein [Pseudomonas sp. HS6]|uniref:glycosyltransferase family 2 protein n=1 Tax=Pseudomonas sp. HS6 TaxID=2850559 RepID=UPI002018495F|nr:glycosyltransferase family 2 protein [Pseudomonas sp. HS6]UQS13052.1 glycosyltransferase family 2 protein [Pseudomonas sp. HS6]
MASPLSADTANSSLDFGTVEVPARDESVAILMCSYNGERFLSEQLASIEQQDHAQWHLFVSDDGSTDSTLDILKAFQARLGEEKVTLLSGPQTGFADNFMSITCLETVSADFYAWSDQDDIWTCDKLSAALARLRQLPVDVPALYASRTTVVNEAGVGVGRTPEFSRAFGFPNALVQSVAAGNTMVFNRAARELLRAGPAQGVVAHDWWAYLLVTGAGGQFHFDQVPRLFYRQHESNSIGANAGFMAALTRIHRLFQGRLRGWIDQNVSALDTVEYLLTEKNREVLRRFKVARSQSMPGRLIGMWRSGVYRQTLLGNLGLVVATIFKGI